MTLQVMLNDPSLYQQQKEAFFSSLFFFFKLAFYECSFYLKKKKTKILRALRIKFWRRKQSVKPLESLVPRHRWELSSGSFRELTLHSFRSESSMSPKSTCDWFPRFQLSRKSRLRYWLASHISSFLLRLPSRIVRTRLKIMLERDSGKAAKSFYSNIKGENNTGLMTLS